MATKSKKERLYQQRQKNMCEIDDFCKEHDFEFEFLTEYQIRIESAVDVYPTNQKYCILRKQRWGQFNRVEDLLTIIENNK